MNRQLSLIDYTATTRAIRADGGATVALDGTVPSSGYAVSLNGYERRIALRYFLGAVELRRYVANHGRALRDPGAHLGAWIDGAEVVLDVTHVIAHRADALALARANGQLAIFDLAQGAEIPTR